MKEKLTAFLLAVLMVAQVIAPQAAWASGNNSNPEKKQDLVKVGELDTKSYPKLDNKTILAIQKQAREKQKSQKRKPGAGFFSKDNPYLPGQNPTDEEKAAAYGRIRVLFETEGLNDNGTLKDFQWREIFGEDSNGNLTNAKIHFIQRNAKTGQELGRYTLNVNQAGEYKWTDTLGKEALLPLYSNTLEPYKYDASLEYQISDKVKLLAMEIGTTDEKTTFTKEGDKNVADIPLKLKLGQVASTKFESEWKTSLDENSRPQVEGLFNTKNKDQDNYDIENLIAFPKNNTDSIKLRNDNVDPNNPPDLPYDQSPGLSFRNVPEVKVVEGLDYSVDPDNGTPTYNFDEANKIITTLDGKHKFKYDFSYDVINGGKLTMTEILPVTFDANGGKFDTITDPAAKQEIKKEVDYDGNLTDKVEEPKKDLETFKGWATAKNGTPLSKEEFEKAKKNIKEAKTFYAIWGNNEITAEELEVKESFKDGTGYVNDFIPTLDQLKAQVKIKDGSGKLQDLATGDTFAIVDGTNEYTTDAAAKDYLYNLLKEDDATEVSRNVTVKAKVTHKNGTSQTVDITIKVIKNIYKADTNGGKPSYVPKDYVKVTLDPTNKAQDPQKTYYYVNKDAQVVIPGKDPVGTPGNNFINWTIPGTPDPEEYNLADRHQFSGETTITANYVDNVVEQIGKDKPKVPDDFVKVIVDTTDKASDETKFTRTFWVKKDTPVRIEVKDPVYKDSREAFAGWKDKSTDAAVNLDQENTFTKDVTEIEASYGTLAIPQLGKDKPDNVPKNFIRVFFDTTDKAEPEKRYTWWVAPNNPSVTLTLYNPVGKKVKDGDDVFLYKWKFYEWENKERGLTCKEKKTDRRVYDLDTRKIKDGDVFKAKYELDFVIPYDPAAPFARPEGYARVTFEAENGLKLEKPKAYYVKKSAGIKLNDKSILKPGVTAETGYKFEKWDREDALVIREDIVVTAKATTIPDVVEKTAEHPNKPDDKYVTVTFKADESGNGTVEEKTYFVNPNKYVTINPPTAKGNTGYEFGSWSQDATKSTNYKTDTIITASFNGLKDVIPKTKDDESEKPAGYKTVTFVIEPATGGKIVEGETTVYYVNPDKEVTVPQPKTNADTGYEFDKWDQDTVTKAKKFTDNTTVKGNFKKLDDIIPSTDGKGKDNAKPDGYITVTFEKGEHGKEITGQTVYYVNPKADPVKTIGEIKKPTVTPETGWKQKAAPDAWDKADTDTITGTQDITVTAQYKTYDDVIPKTKQDESEKPEGYITVTFEKGEHGTLEGTTVYYVNPDKAVVLKDKAPKVKPDTGYKSAGWDTTIEKAIQYEDGDKIVALYNKLGDISTTEVEGYVKVEFKPGTNGSLEGTQAYWIKPGVAVNVPAPTVKPNVGYKFDKWDKPLTVTAKANDPTYEITAQYATLDDVIPQKNTDGSDKPNGYVTVTFDKGDHGVLSGQTVYYVNPTKNVTLTAPTVTADLGFKQKADGEAWDKALEGKFTEDTTIKAQYDGLEDVIPKTKQDDSEKPKGYVTVKLIPTDKATDATKAEKVYFVNPTKNVTITNKPVGTTVKDANGITYTYTFKGWTTTKGTIASWTGANITGKFIQDTDITAKYSTKVDLGTLIPAPVGKKDVVTPKGEVPKASTLIENKDKMPNGTKITYVEEPKVNESGETKAKVKVEYPGGKTVVVEVPITVVDNVVPQTGKDKPKVPDTYVKVTVDTTDAATPNTKFTKVFWVKPDVEVTIPGILAPAGKEVTEDGVTKTNKFVKWQRQGATPDKFYETEIKDTFTNDTTIVAIYEYDKNVEPKPDNGKWIPKGSTPTAKEFIKNAYNDGDPKNKENLPPGTSYEFVPGNVPNTNEQGKGKTTKIKVTYPNGEVKIVDVTYNVTGDVVKQPNPNDDTTKPVVPDNFVKVTVDPTNKAQDSTTQVFWVNPEKTVTIPADIPEGKDEGQFRYVFTGWNHELTAQFTEPETTIKARYVEKKYDPEVDTYWVLTDKNVQPEPKDYKDKIKPSSGEYFTVEEIVKKPDVSKPSTTSFATIRIKFNNGATKEVEVPVFVKPDPIIEEKPYPVPGDCNNSCDQPNQPNKPGESNKPNQPNIGMDALNTTDHYQYLIGYPDGNFAPNRGMTRAEVATMFTRLLRERPVKGQRYYTGFSDIQAGDWYANTVGYAVKVGIVSGYPDGSFKPNKPITRAEFAAIASRFDALAQGNNIAFNDLAPSHWGYNAIRSAASKGWITGYPDDTFRPEKAITRAEVTSITNRMLNRYADLYWIDAHRAEVIRFGDVKRSDWYFEPIMEATMGHDFIRDRDGKTEHWSGLNGKSFI